MKRSPFGKLRPTIVVTVVAGLLLLPACGGGGADDSPEVPSSVEASQAEVDSEQHERVAEEVAQEARLAEAVQATFNEDLDGRSIGDLCQDDGPAHWACFYEGIEPHSVSAVRVVLTTDGGWSRSELERLAERAGRQWFNATGEAHPELDTVIVRVDGVDHNVSRDSIPSLDR